jgi:DNA (cytosine-5)-methyltransferase 1
MKTHMKIVSLFSGCGGMDLGFQKAGFEVVWANEYDASIWETYAKNHPQTQLEKRSIRDVASAQIPDDIVGVIGGPPCQSFSEAGKGLGIEDQRGQLFFEYIRVIRDKKPLFFVAENVSGMLHPKHRETVKTIINQFAALGYTVNFELVNANDFDVPQDRKRVFFVGYDRRRTNKLFHLTSDLSAPPCLKDAIFDLRDSAAPARDKNKTHGASLAIPNHEYMTGGFSTIYMSRNRVRGWDEPSFTIQAGGRHAPLHPQAPKMRFIEQNVRQFVQGEEHLYRRLSVRECARIQTFPDTFTFHYTDLADGYKMVGNAVPVNLAYHIASKIKADLFYASTEETQINAVLKWA